MTQPLPPYASHITYGTSTPGPQPYIPAHRLQALANQWAGYPQRFITGVSHLGPEAKAVVTPHQHTAEELAIIIENQRLLDLFGSTYDRNELTWIVWQSVEKLLDECSGQEGFLAFDGYDDWEVSFHVGFTDYIDEPEYSCEAADGTKLSFLNWTGTVMIDEVKVDASWLKREGARSYTDQTFQGSVFVPPRKLSPAARDIYQTFRTDGMSIQDALATAEACAA